MDKVTVLVVEDDFRVADINRQVVEQVEGFQVVKVVKTGEEALSFLESNRIDLVILDVYLPGLQGIELLQEIRSRGYPIDFILITAAHDSKTIEDSMRYGVFDYLIKPFDFSRFRESLGEFQVRRATLAAAPPFDQVRIDQILKKKEPALMLPDLPKGISPQTLMRIQAVIDDHGKTIMSSDLVEALSLSRITAQRYLDHLATSGQLRKELLYKKVGRPSVVYVKVE